MPRRRSGRIRAFEDGPFHASRWTRAHRCGDCAWNNDHNAFGQGGIVADAQQPRHHNHLSRRLRNRVWHPRQRIHDGPWRSSLPVARRLLPQPLGLRIGTRLRRQTRSGLHSTHRDRLCVLPRRIVRRSGRIAEPIRSRPISPSRNQLQSMPRISRRPPRKTGVGKHRQSRRSGSGRTGQRMRAVSSHRSSPDPESRQKIHRLRRRKTSRGNLHHLSQRIAEPAPRPPSR